MEPVKLFISYDSQDEGLCKELAKHLCGLENRGDIEILHKGKVAPGAELAKEIAVFLGEAKIILLLLSKDYLSSEDSKSEMDKAMKLRDAKIAHVLPVLLHPFDLETTPIGDLKLKLLPANGIAVTSWPNRDDAFVEVERGIKESLKRLTGFWGRSYTFQKRKVTPKSLCVLAIILTLIISYMAIQVTVPNIDNKGSKDSFTGTNQWDPDDVKWNVINSPRCIGRRITGDKKGLFKSPDSKNPFSLYQDFDLVIDWRFSNTCPPKDNTQSDVRSHIVFPASTQPMETGSHSTKSRELAWLIRAQSENNYYLFKLEVPLNEENGQVLLHFLIRDVDSTIEEDIRRLPDKINSEDDAVTIITEARDSSFNVKIMVNSHPTKDGFSTNEMFSDKYDRFQYGGVGLTPVSGKEFFVTNFTIIPKNSPHPVLRRLKKFLL